MNDGDIHTALVRIEDQARRAVAGEAPRGLENEPLGLYGLTKEQVFLSNILAIAAVALGKKVTKR